MNQEIIRTTNTFTLVESYDLYLEPADKTSKLDVTVDGTAVTPDNEGKVAEVGKGKTVRINAKRGYVIEQMKVKK